MRPRPFPPENHKVGQRMRIKRKRPAPETVESSREKTSTSSRPGPLPKEVSWSYGSPKPISHAEFCPDCRYQFFVLKDSWGGGWHVCHFPTCSLIVYNAPSKAYALKVFANILPLIDLHKAATQLWYGDRRPLMERVEAYLANVWKCEYPIEEIPSVKTWLKSGFGNTAKDVRTFRSKLRVKIKRKQ